MTTPHIIRSINGLPDPDALLMGITDELHPGVQVMYAADWEADYLIDSTGIFPLAVIATGEQVRAARKALEEA